MQKLPPIYQKLLDMMREQDTNQRNEMEHDISRKFRLSRDDVRGAFRDLEKKGLITSGKRYLDINV
jgi:DNA-binding FadR family transcriptional regulator